MANEQTFFDFAVEVGLTKHIGGLESTQELLELCHIAPGGYILDVGCGAGVTPAYIAKRYDCSVVGVDISEKMILRSEQWAQRKGVVDRLEFRVADAQDLPFQDEKFDAVISESVTAFPPDKQRAVNEYARVTKPDCYVGLNESTWLKTPPPPEMVAWVSQDVGATVKPLTSAEWVGLLKGAGLKDIVAKSYRLNVKDETRGIFQRYGVIGMLRVLSRTLKLYLSNPAYRQFVKDVRQNGVTPKNLDNYFGYGIYVGRKPASWQVGNPFTDSWS